MSEASSETEISTCPSCGKQDPNLTKLDTALKLTLKHDGVADIPEEACLACLKKFKKQSTHGAQLRARDEAKDNQKGDLWKNRTQLVRQARAFMRQGSYAEAAICYEKYFKILEIVYKTDRNGLDPKLFKDRPKEITIIASSLWDLLLIYDGHEKFSQKQMQAAEMLSKFLRFSPLYNSILRKAELEFKKAKNPAAIRLLLKLCDVQASRCFIATATFDSRMDPNVQILCNFRDRILKKNYWGRKFVYFYYRYSPSIAAHLDLNPVFKRPLRHLLRGVATLLKVIFRLPERRDS
ncbi:MAG: hypothetical protein HRT44_04200 [Bdellovibrionales bacterium]|nr:hypothetical protein [Bdellovibrionales bacterium]NQZ18445.1 hypothetical protein [Bdellovibrionales bacterium]